MTQRSSKPARRGALILVAGGALACAFVAGHRVQVLAEGAPTSQPLFYSGTLEVDGAPANGQYTVTMTLHDAESDGNELCGTEVASTVEAGRFRIDASDCQDAIAMEPDTWVQLKFEGSDGVEHVIPRAKVGAVPYALEADHALSASSPTGALAATIQQLTNRISTLEAASARSSAFIAQKDQDSPQTIVQGDGQAVIFNAQLLDVGNEYDPTTGEFIPKQGGLYEFSCTIAWSNAMGTPGTWEVAFAKNGWEYTYNGSYGEGFAVTRTLTSVLELAAGDKVTCTALQSHTSSPLNVSVATYNVFSGHRI